MANAAAHLDPSLGFEEVIEGFLTPTAWSTDAAVVPGWFPGYLAQVPRASNVPGYHPPSETGQWPAPLEPTRAACPPGNYLPDNEPPRQNVSSPGRLASLTMRLPSYVPPIGAQPRVLWLPLFLPE